MRPRYLVLTGGSPEERAAVGQWAASATGLTHRIERRTATILTNANCRCHAGGEEAALVGTLFRRGEVRPVEKLEAGDVRAMLASGGETLLSRFWGGYVAIVSTSQGIKLFRDPSAALPCYFARRGGMFGFASDAAMLVAAGLATIAFDWPAMGRQFFNAGVPVAATALSGVRELLPGFAVDVGAADERQTPSWSPWDHVDPAGGRSEELAERLARTVTECVQGWCSSRGRLLLSVSGGVDSSIVAACIAGAGLDAFCLTIYGEDAAGDERAYARALCDHFGLKLLERPDRLEDIDIATPYAPHLPRPVGRSQALSYEKNHVEAAAEFGAGAFVTGNGGDSVFGYSQSAGAIADLYLSRGLTPALAAATRDVVRQTGCSIFEAAAAALRLASGPRSYQVRPERTYLHPDLIASLEAEPPAHPWLEAPRNAMPGKAAHIASILRVQHCLEPGRSRFLPVINPLMSQPIMELCLGIPSWLWREGGRDRAVARTAFAARLPRLVAERRVKGGPDGFGARVLARYRSQIRERLLGGHLASRFILDRQALEQVLGEQRPTLGEERVRLFQLLNAEAWIESWMGVQREPVGLARADPPAVISDG